MNGDTRDAHAAADADTLLIHASGAALPPWSSGLGWHALEVRALESDPDEASRLLHRAGCVVLDAAMPYVVHAARIAHALDANVQVIIVTSPDAVAAVRRSLLYASGVGEIWIASPSEVTAALAESASGVTQQRRRYERTRARLASETLTSSPQRAARALISDAYLAALLGVLPDAVFSVDSGGRVLSANAAAETMFRGDRATVAGARLTDVIEVAGRQDGEERTLLELAADSGFVEIRFRRALGTDGVAELRAVPIGRDDNAAPARSATEAWAVVLHDVTEHHEANTQLRDLAMEMETQTEELQASADELAERTTDAEHARDAAEAANRARADFIATMSHEIRTPINAIIGYTQLLELGVPDPVSLSQRTQLGRVSGAAKHLLGLVDDVLDMAKVDAGALRVRDESVRLDRMIDEALDVVRPMALERNLVVQTELARAGLAVRGDEARVRQIVVNLLSNAIKFTSSPGRITIECGESSSADAGASPSGTGPWIHVRVIDTGIGIAQQHQASVFEPFVQAESGLTRTKGGSGLGLTISRRLARLMGGDVLMKSIEGQGATFTLWLPAASIARHGDAGESSTAPRAAAVDVVGGDRAIRPYGLAEIGAHLRGRVEEVLAAVATRLRADPAFAHVTTLRQSELEDHLLAFLVDIVTSLVVIDETGGASSQLYRNGSEIQRVVTALHGRLRQDQEWTEGELDQEFVIVAEEIEALMRRHVPDGLGDVRAAMGVLRHLIDQGRAISLDAYRQAGHRS